MSSNQHGQELRDSWAAGRKLVQDLGLSFKEVKAFQGRNALFAKCHASFFSALSEHCPLCSFAGCYWELP